MLTSKLAVVRDKLVLFQDQVKEIEELSLLLHLIFPKELILQDEKIIFININPWSIFLSCYLEKYHLLFHWLNCLKLLNHDISNLGNSTLFHRAKPIEKILRKDIYWQKLLKGILKKGKYWQNHLRKGF